MPWIINYFTALSGGEYEHTLGFGECYALVNGSSEAEAVHII